MKDEILSIFQKAYHVFDPLKNYSNQLCDCQKALANLIGLMTEVVNFAKKQNRTNNITDDRAALTLLSRKESDNSKRNFKRAS